MTMPRSATLRTAPRLASIRRNSTPHSTPQCAAPPRQAALRSAPLLLATHERRK